MTIKEKIIQLSDKILEYLLEYRKADPNFRFWMRSREHSRSGDGERLSKGQWFQGSDYIFLSFHSASGHVNMTRSIGWAIQFDRNLEPYFHISIVWPTEADKRKIDLYLDIIQQLGGFKKETETKYRKDLPGKDVFESLSEFAKETKPEIDKIIEKHGLTNLFTIPEEKFQKQLEKVLYHRQKLLEKRSDANASSDDYGKSLMEDQTFPLNLILYGPPGTGKTYNTVNVALEAIGEEIGDMSRKEIKELFDRRQKEGRIVFTTFHQSMSYEDFIEGIKPQKPQAGETLKYDIEKGVFKRICELAQSNFENSRKENQQRLPFEEAFEKFQDEWEENTLMKFPLKTPGYDFTIYGFTNTSIQFRKASGGTSHTLSINTLKELYYGKDFNFKEGVGIYYPSILNKLYSYHGHSGSKADLQNYVIIIDEINRGNVSQIFGELITLIEDDKRIGNSEALAITLPYSKETFSVPPNLFIIGTMNTADRSVEALDTALRRRFSFEEIVPDPSLIKVRPEGIDLALMLDVINKRLQALLTKDHTIGHAWLMSVKSLYNLQDVFKSKIFPLLQEYFFNDFGKIGLVLGSKFVKSRQEGVNLFPTFGEAADIVADYAEKNTYILSNPFELEAEDFRSIYK